MGCRENVCSFISQAAWFCTRRGRWLIAINAQPFKMMTWVRVNQIPTLAGAKWSIASRPATLCRLKLADVTVYAYAGAECFEK